MAWLRGLVLSAVALAGLLCTASPAAATFPGRNGEIVVLTWRPVGSPVFHNTLTLIDPRTAAVRRLGLCPPNYLSDRLPCEGSGSAAVSPDGQRIAFVMGDGNDANHQPTNYLLALMPFGGTQSSKVSLIHREQDPAYPYYTGLAWSPDGARLVLGGYDGDAEVGQLSFLRTDGRLTGRIIKRAISPDWSVDGRLAFTRSWGRHADLFVGRPSGPFRRLTRKGASDPSWSPHGRRIAFLRNGAVYVMPSKGGRARRLVEAGPLVDSFGGPPWPSYTYGAPVWSPDGKQLVFVRHYHRNQSSEVYTLNLKTKKLRFLYSGIDKSDQVFALDWRPLPR